MAQAVRAGPSEMENGKRAADDEMVDQKDGKRAKSGITSDAEALLTQTSAKLSKGRKKRAIPEGTAAEGDIEAMSLTSSHPLHKTSKVRTLKHLQITGATPMFPDEMVSP